MRTRTQLVVAVIVAVLAYTGSGCGGSSVVKSPAAGSKSEPKDGDSGPLGEKPSPSIALVTFHVQDMGTKLNLL